MVINPKRASLGLRFGSSETRCHQPLVSTWPRGGEQESVQGLGFRFRVEGLRVSGLGFQV